MLNLESTLNLESVSVSDYIFTSAENKSEIAQIPTIFISSIKNVFRLELQAMCMCIHSIYAQVLMERGALSLCSIASKRTLDSDHPLLRIYIVWFMLVMKEKWGRAGGSGERGEKQTGRRGGRETSVSSWDENWDFSYYLLHYYKH